jgi:hypothetical protein
MLDPRVLAVAATGLLPPDVVARLAGMSEAELRHRHGAEIEAAQRACRRQALTAILMARPSPEALQTVLEADDADGRPGERRLLRGDAVLKLAAFAHGGTHGRHVEACAVLLALDDDTWQAAGDAVGLPLCDPCRSGLPEHNCALIRQHLEGIFQDARARPALRRQAGRVLLSALR